MKRYIFFSIKIIVFLLIFVFIFYTLQYLSFPFHEPASAYQFLYEMPDECVDLLIVGSSSLRCGISPNVLWKEYGVSSYHMSANTMAPYLHWYNVNEFLKYQTPKVALLGMQYAFSDYEPEGYVTRVANYIACKEYSPEKMDAANFISQKNDEISKLYVFFPFFKHYNTIFSGDTVASNMKRLIDNDSQVRYYGQKITNAVTPLNSNEFSSRRDNKQLTATFSEESLDYYTRSIEICRERGVVPIIVIMPRVDWDYARHTATAQYAEELGVTFIDFNFDGLLEELGVDWATDFFDSNHLNIAGTAKISKYLGALLVEEYGIQDRRTDPEYPYLEKRNRDAETYYTEFHGGT